MRARALAEPFPVVAPDADALHAARSMAAAGHPGLIVTDADGHPYTVLPGPVLLRALLPGYLQEDPVLARALDEAASDQLCAGLASRTVGDLLPRTRDLDDLPVVDGDATPLEVAAVMARMRSPLVAVVEGGSVVGAITVSRLLGHLLAGGPVQP
jgi:CBS domain-containing protein